MVVIDAPIHERGDRFVISCKGCEREVDYASRAGALAALKRENCRNCRIDYRAKDLPKDAVYKNDDGKWCSSCASCGTEQAYTRMDHAKTSSSSGWRCKACAAADKAFTAEATGFDGNVRVGWLRKFEVSARQRGLKWELSADFVNGLWERQEGCCALSGIPLLNGYKDETVSIDRIDSSHGYTEDNVQLIHKQLNMMKRNMPNGEFIRWCRAVAIHNADKVKW
jgi:hypothetical protein